MEKQEFNQKIMSEFSIAELDNINSKIYYNPDHVDYYMDYNRGNYQKCYDYLIQNRHLLK